MPITASLPLLTRQRILAAKIEAVAGTAETLAAADAGFRVFDRELKIMRDTIAREAQGSFGSDSNVAGAAHTELTFKTHLHGGGTGILPGWAGILLPACGMKLTTSTYANSMDTTSWKTITAGHYQAGRLKVGAGMMGSWKLTGEVGKPGELDWKFVGAWRADPTAVNVLTGMTYEAVSPPILAGAASITLDGSAAFRISKFELDQGGDPKPREDANSAGGYLMGYIGARDGKLTIDPETMPVGSIDWHAIQTSNTTVGFTAVFGTATDDTITITVPSMNLSQAPGDKDRNGRMVDDLSFLVNQDNISIAFS